MLNNLLIASDAIDLVSDFVKARILNSGTEVNAEALLAVQEQLQLLKEAKALPYEQWWTLLEQVQITLGQPALGLSIGEYVKVEYLGCLGYLLKTSEDLEQALRCFERFQRLLYDGNRAAIQYERDRQGSQQVKLIWEADYGYSNQLSDELLISGLLHLVREMLADKAIRPVRIEFTNTIPVETEAIYREYFGCEICSSQPNLCVVFRARDFSLPIQGGDQQLHRLISTQAENLLEQAPNADASSILIKVRKIMVRALHEGEPTVETIASQLHMSSRSLHRHLKEEGAVFRDILKETRKSLARKYLTDAKLSIPEVALMLGYSEQSAFSRAFRQWFDETPLQYRKRAL